MFKFYHKRHGITLVEVMIVITIIGILALLAVPNYMTYVGHVRKDTCINNLRAINLAKEQWALENNKDVGDDAPTAAQLDNYLREDIWDDGYTTGHSLICPLDDSDTPTFGTSYTVNAIGTDPICKKSTDHRL